VLNVVQAAPFHSATRALEWRAPGELEPTAKALLDD